MKTRKQQTLVKKGVRQRPAKRTAARRRAGAGKAASGTARKGRTRQGGSLILAGECTVAEADSLKAQLVRRLPEPKPVVVDISALQRIDTAALQLLAAFVRDRRMAGHAVTWHGRAPALEAAASLLGLNDMLELPKEAGR